MKIEQVNINDLKCAEYNPRISLTPEDEAFKNILESIKNFGMVEPIVINKDYTVIGGHQRLNVCKYIGWDFIPCNIIEVNKKKEKKLNIALNKISGDWDKDKLFDLLDSLKDDEFSLSGFTNDEFIELEEEIKNFDETNNSNNNSNTNTNNNTSEENIKNDNFDIVEESKKIKNVLTKIGDIYKLGNHYLMCGDSTNKTHTDMLIKHFNINKTLIFTDPPYGVDIVKDGKIGNEKIAMPGEYENIIGDNSIETAKKNYKICVDYGLDKFIIWGGNYFLDFLNNFDLSWIIWDKRGGGTSDNYGDGEIAISSLKHKIKIYKHLWRGMIQEGKREIRIHPTQKPVAMLSQIIKTFENKDLFSYIIDFFGGSGSTMLAAENFNLKSGIMELSPNYCDLIIKRFVEYRDGKNDDLFILKKGKYINLSKINEYKNIINI